MTLPNYPNLPDEFVQSCLEKMDELGEQHAIARASLRSLEKKEKVILSEIIASLVEKGVRATAAKDQAYGDARYRKWWTEYSAAVEIDIRADEECQIEKTRFEAWRTVSATLRRT